MSALSVAAIVGGTVASVLITAGFIAALVLSKRDYSLTATFKVAPRSASGRRAVAAESAPAAPARLGRPA